MRHPLVQLGFVVRDLKAAQEYWTEELGVGPFFFIEHVTRSHYLYKGQSTMPDVSVALADWDGIQIELIQQNNDDPSPHSDFFSERGAGLNHLCIDPPDYHGEIARRASLGQEPVASSHAGADLVVFHDGDWDMPAIELLDRKASPQVQRLTALIAEAAKDWDGTEPWRPVPPLE